jgi:hypothetical protein
MKNKNIKYDEITKLLLEKNYTAQIENSLNVLKSLLYIIVSSFAVSIGLLKLFNSDKYTYTPVLVTGWCILFISLILIILQYMKNSKIYSLFINRFAKILFGSFDVEQENQSILKYPDLYLKISLILYCLGFALIIIFFGLNIL